MRIQLTWIGVLALAAGAMAQPPGPPPEGRGGRGPGGHPGRCR